ncbi:PEP-CTERM sorting domain-containing protein [Gordonia namibiensis]
MVGLAIGGGFAGFRQRRPREAP